jgi:pilus assembly protein CpaF
VTEIVPLPPGLPYPDYIEDDGGKSMDEITREYYLRRTDRCSFITRDIIRYNLDTHTYEVAEWFSEDLTRYMLNCMDEQAVRDFREFAHENWGVMVN